MRKLADFLDVLEFVGFLILFFTCVFIIGISYLFWLVYKFLFGGFSDEKF